MNHHGQIAFYKAKFKFWDFFHTIAGLVLMVFPLIILFTFAEGQDALLHMLLALFVIDLIALIVLTVITNGIGNKADDYCSEFMLKPILDEMFYIYSFESRGHCRNFLRNLHIFTDSDNLMTWSRFKCNYNNTEIEAFDFIGYSRMEWGFKDFGSKGHAAIVKLHQPFPGTMVMRSNTLAHKGEQALRNLFNREHLESFSTGIPDFIYEIWTNNPQATNYVFNEDVLDTICSIPMDKRHILSLEFKDEYAYIFIKDNYWPTYNHHRNHGSPNLVNTNGVWGADDAEEIEEKMRYDWNQMLTLIDICSRY